jgi:hypothetical protein
MSPASKDATADDSIPAGPPTRASRPVIDVSPALGEAGHECELLGYDGVPDSGAVLHRAGSDEDMPEDAERRILDAMATRGVGGVT